MVAERGQQLAAAVEMAPMVGDRGPAPSWRARAASTSSALVAARRCAPTIGCGPRRPAVRSSRARRGAIVRASEASARRPSASSRSRVRASRASSSRGCSRELQRARRMPCARVLASRARPRRRSTASKRCRGRASRSARRGSPRTAARRCARMPSSARRAAMPSRSPSLPVCSTQLGILGHRPFGGLGGRGGARIGGEIDERPVGLVADGGDERDGAGGGGAHHHLLVEAPQVLQAAAAAGDDQHVGPRDAAARRQAH